MARQPRASPDHVRSTTSVASSGRSFVGCSGYDYADWRGRVYADDLPRRQWLRHYASTFDTVELNSTFYRLPSERAVEQWAETVSPGFVFAVKLGAFGSHRKKLRDAKTWLPNHVDRFAAFGPALGPTLVQLPPHWRRDVARLDEFLLVAPPTMRWALEVRDPSWLHDDVFDLLQRFSVALCIHDLLDDHPPVLTADWTYVRFHGPHARERPYHGSYGERHIERWSEWINARLAEGLDVHAYFNNDFEAHAFGDAARLRHLLTA